MLPSTATAPVAACTVHLPFAITDFTDFMTSEHHVRRATEALSPDGVARLPPGWPHFPIAYCSRTSAVVVGGTDVVRPVGWVHSPTGSSSNPVAECVPSRRLDYELEFGVFLARGLERSRRLTAAELSEDGEGFREHVFGFVLVNDWSARDIQALEMVPLGPFAGKSFATTVSGWVVTVDAVMACSRPEKGVERGRWGAMPDMRFEVAVTDGEDGVKTTTGTANITDLKWNFADMIAHQCLGGCGLRTGDLLSSGTLSGAGDHERGCLLETTWGGTRTWKTEGKGREKTWLEGGDCVTMTAFAGTPEDGVGWGESSGVILPAV